MFFKKKKEIEEVKEESLIEHYRHKPVHFKKPELARDEIIKSIFQRDFSMLMPKNSKGQVVAMDGAVCKCKFNGNIIPNDILEFYGSNVFIGYEACAILRQNPYIDKACTIPAQDSIASDYKISYAENNKDEKKVDEKKLEEMKRISDKDYNIKEVCYHANVNKKTFGISLVVPVVDGVDYKKPYSIDKVKKGSYKGMVVVEPYWVSPQLDSGAVSNPMNVGFQEPTWWRMPDGTVVHKSWCIKKCNSELPDILKPTYYYGGVPLTQKIYERVYAAEKVANEAPQLALTKRMLIADANIANLMANPEECQSILNLVQWARDNFSVWFKNPDDQVSQIDTSLTDFDALVMTQYQLVASIADMPATKLLKTQPKGFNATGEYEQKDYIQSLQAIQEQDYMPILKMHYELFTKSFYGELIDLSIVFNPIDTPTEKETAEVAKIWSDIDSNYIASGVVSADEIRDIRRSEEGSAYSTLADDIEGEVMPEVDNAVDEALDEKWITVKNDHGNEEEKGRHLLLEDGETPAEAMKRQWGVEVKKEEKKDELKKENHKGEEKTSEPEKENKPVSTIKATQYTEEEVKNAERKPFIDTKEGVKMYTEWSDEKDSDKKKELEEAFNKRNKEYREEGYKKLPNSLKEDKYYMSESDFNDVKATTSIYTSAGLNKERRSFDLQPINSRKYSDRMNVLDITRGNLVEMDKDEAMKRWAKMPHSEGAFGGLSHSEEQIIKQYTYATPQNSELRKGKEIKSAKELSKIIDRSLSREQKVYRGISGDYAKELLNKKVGDVFDEKAFLSTSQDIEIAKNFAKENGAILHISIPREYGKAIDVSEYTLHPEESEILINKGQSFKITKKEGNNIFLEFENKKKAKEIKDEALDEWDESKHPRDKVGRFTDGSNFNQAGHLLKIGGSAKGSQNSEKIFNSEQLNQVEKEIYLLDEEEFALFNEEGILIGGGHGNSNSVSLDSIEKEKFNNSILTHNHPDNSIFSVEDLLEGLKERKVAELRVTNKSGKVYSLKVNENSDIDNFIKSYKKTLVDANVNNRGKLLKDAKNKTAEELNFIVYNWRKWEYDEKNRILKEFLKEKASKYGITFKEEKIS